MAERVGHKDREHIRAVFAEAYRQPQPQRAQYLDEACRGDAALRREIESLLNAYEAAGDFLEATPVCPPVALYETPIVEGPGTIIGRYKLLEKIGEGGMAMVYMAEQTEPIRRKVALKIIKLGMDTKQVIARFEAERQALALMDHPCIAKVLDAGATETGRPYFVMELVQGVSITEYCDQNNLSTKDRLALFLQVCQAVQHAHQKGIIHRDIKPSNVMVTRHDGSPVPKVIDFGIAKATNQKLTEKTLFTRYAHIIGTPAYMSPEQAELSDLDIDTRSDIYSLGVLLYELLTGATPFSEEELRKAGYIEMQRIIREQEPAKPSTKLNTLGDTLGDIAKHRGSTPDLLRRSIRGDLDWIVMKSLEKDRTHRYEGANTLAEDIGRHLEHEPVVARGPGATYRLRKFLRRHCMQTIVALALAIFAGLAMVIFSLWHRDRLQLAEAEGFRDRGVLSQAREQYARAERDAALETIKPVLQSKYIGPEAQLLYAGILVDNRRSDEAAAILNNLLEQQPDIAGAAHSLLARILWEKGSLGEGKLKQIEEHRRQAEALLPETAEAYFLRAMTALTVKEQLAALDKALQLDSMHYESRRLRAFTYYASRKYERLNEDALAMETLRDRDPLAYTLRAAALRELGRYRDAVAEYDRALALTHRDNPQYRDLAAQRCETFLRLGDYARVVSETRAYLQFWPGQPVLQYRRFCALVALGDYDTAAALFRQIIRAGLKEQRQFKDGCVKYVFDTLGAGRSWHPPGRVPAGAAFLSMIEAEEDYQRLSTKGQRMAIDGFSPQWSPDGSKLAFSLGVLGYSGVALYDPATRETDLLIVPGKDPVWSPDGKSIAFVRDCQALRLEELATVEPMDQQRWAGNEEVWAMKADGTEPRRLARGNRPSWGEDSNSVYYSSPADKTLYSMSLIGPEAKPKRVMACPCVSASVSPDGTQVVYFEGGTLKIQDLVAQAPVAHCAVPCMMSVTPAWSPTGRAICFGGSNPGQEKLGLWVYSLDRKELASVLEGPVWNASWSAQTTKLTFCLTQPYFEIWTADLDPNLLAMEASASGQSMNVHLRQMADFWTRRIQADPTDANNYVRRAQQYEALHKGKDARADLRRYWAALNPGLPPWFRLRGPWALMHAIDGPFDYQLVVFTERQEDGMQLLRIAFGQKGRCEMKRCEIPMVVTSLLGLCLLSGLDAPPARADFMFGRPINTGLTIQSDAEAEGLPVISPDGLELYFVSGRPGGRGGEDIWMAKRASIDAPWEPPVNMAQLNTPKRELVGSISSDGLTLYIEGSPTKWGDLYTAMRPTKDAPWGPRVNMGPTLNRTDGGGGPGWGHEGSPIISADDLELFFYSNRPGTVGLSDIYVSTRATSSDPWGPPVNLGPTVNSATDDFCFAISPDGLVLFMIPDYQGNGYGTKDDDMWMTRRPYKGGAWSPPVRLGPSFNTACGDILTSITLDGQLAYFRSNRFAQPTDSYLWMAPIIPVADFNGDEIVDANDQALLTEHLGQTDPQYDIGPFAWGDGMVDANDMEVLTSYLGQEILNPAPEARWKLDETEGQIAHDSSGSYEGTSHGDPVWQPEGGHKGGALQFDGVDDYISTPEVMMISRPFSAWLWVKGGDPNQAILSQANGATWLMTSPSGTLITTFKGSAKHSGSLTSAAVITDGAWHQVGLVWDGQMRTLYVDGAEVAKDTESQGEIPTSVVWVGGMHIGTMSSPVGLFWSGLIDEVRLYDRIVEP